MTTGDKLVLHSNAPHGSTALAHLMSLCDCNGDAVAEYIPVNDIDCDLINTFLGADIVDEVYACDLQTDTLDAIIADDNLDGNIDNNIDGDLGCQQ